MHGRHTALLAAFLALGCGASAASPDADGSGDTQRDPSSNDAIEVAAGPGTTPGFVDEPSVRFPEQAANSTSQVDCIESPRPISEADARTLGFDVDADRAMLERTYTGDVLVSRERVTPSTLHVRSQLDRVWLVEYRTPPRQGGPRLCPSVVRYDVVVQLYTSDGALSGSFISQKRATPVGAAPQPFLEAVSDLRNFSGDLPVAWDGATGAFGTARIFWGFEDPGRDVFDFEARVWRDVSSDCGEPDCVSVAATSDFLSRGIHTGETGSVGDLLTDLRGYIENPVVSTLERFAAAMGPYQRNVSAWVLARSAPPTQIQVRTRVNAEVSTATVDLAYDWRRVVEGAVIGWLNLGPLDEGTQVSLEVEGESSIADLQSDMLVGGCSLATAYDRCQGPGCNTRSALTVVSAACAKSVE